MSDAAAGAGTADSELLSLRTALGVVRDGLALESAVERCLDQALAALELDFGCVYVRRHDYLLRIASRGLTVPRGPDSVLVLDEAPWVQRPFTAQLSGGPEGRLPHDVAGKCWLSLPLRIGPHLTGLLLIGGYRKGPAELPPTRALERIAGHLAVVIDNAERFQQLRGLLNDARDVIFRTDAGGRLVYLNPAWYETTGEAQAAALGRRLVSYLEPEARRRLGPGLEALVPRGSVIGRQTLPLAGDRPRYVDIQARLVRDDRGAIVGTAGVLRDVTLTVRQAQALREANQELRVRAGQLEAANRELAEADRLKSEFLANLSHELRTPLGIISGYAELLGDLAGALPEPGGEYLRGITENAGRLERAIVQLLDLALIEAGRVETAGPPVSLATVLRGACDAAEPAVRAADMTLTPALVPAGTRVAVAPDRLRQVLGILLENAVEFGRPGGRIVVAVGLRRDVRPMGDDPPAGPPRYAAVTVTDDGVGIRPERLPGLGRKFVQADGGDTREHGGLGLGLAISRALIERMGGRLELHSDGLELGTTAGLTVPLAS